MLKTEEQTAMGPQLRKGDAKTVAFRPCSRVEPTPARPGQAASHQPDRARARAQVQQQAQTHGNVEHESLPSIPPSPSSSSAAKSPNPSARFPPASQIFQIGANPLRFGQSAGPRPSSRSPRAGLVDASPPRVTAARGLAGLEISAWITGAAAAAVTATGTAPISSLQGGRRYRVPRISTLFYFGLLGEF
jgi:hypothetical protein